MEQSYIDKLLKLNDQLQALPAWPLVVVGVLACGYALKAMPFIVNRWIPCWLLILAVIGYEFLGVAAVPVGSNWRAWLTVLVRNFILAVVAWGMAWRVHTKWLRKLESTGDTELLAKPPGP